MSNNPTIGLVTRTRNKWKRSGKRRTVEDNAVALGYIVWQLALNGARKLHADDFRYDDDHQRMRVIEEYLAYLIHLADRTAFDSMDESQRTEFVTATARSAARHPSRYYAIRIPGPR